MTTLFKNLPAEVTIYEVGPRDGLQNEPQMLPTADKLELIDGLVDAGIRAIEITSFVNPRWIPGLADHTEVATRIKRRPDTTYSALVPNLRGLEGAFQTGMKDIAIFLAASETHNRKNINKSTSEALKTYSEVLAAARAKNLRVRGYISCVYGCPYEGEVPLQNTLDVARALLDMGVYQLSLGDTIGVGTPRQVEHILTSLLEAGVPQDTLAVHFHDTRGTALANITCALQLGITTIDSAVGGLGGCPYAPGASGNVATEDVLYLLHGMGIKTGVDLEKIVKISARLSALLGRELPSKYLKAYLGRCTPFPAPT